MGMIHLHQCWNTSKVSSPEESLIDKVLHLLLHGRPLQATNYGSKLTAPAGGIMAMKVLEITRNSTGLCRKRAQAQVPSSVCVARNHHELCLPLTQYKAPGDDMNTHRVWRVYKVIIGHLSTRPLLVFASFAHQNTT